MSKNEPYEYMSAGKLIECSHCGNVHFVKSATMLNTRGMTLLGLDWANATASTLICTRCSMIQWFATPPTRRATQ